MWEYSICVRNINSQIASYILSSLKKCVEKTGGVATFYKDKDFCYIVVGTDEKYKEKIQNHVCITITKVICTFFKGDFLNRHLNIPISDKISKIAFKNALINFDKETDFYIISKALSFENNLYLESFYNFKLQKLRSKWEELISLANENRDYFINSDSFFDLLKFLVDNIDINENEIDVVEDDDGYRIFSGSEDNCFECLDGEGLVSSVIGLSPQKINMYCKKENNATEILKKIYEKRVNFRFSREKEQNSLTFLKL